MGDRHLATVPQVVTGDHLPWGGVGRVRQLEKARGEATPPRTLLVLVTALSHARRTKCTIHISIMISLHSSGAAEEDGSHKISAEQMVDYMAKADKPTIPSAGDHDIVVRAMHLRSQYQERMGIDPNADLSWFVAMDFAEHESEQVVLGPAFQLV